MQETAIKYLIYGVKNLTDARYFTAMGVEYLHFDLDPKSNYAISQKDFEEIIAWVEGPKILCSIDHLFDVPQIKALIESPSIHGVVSYYPDLLNHCKSIKDIEAFLRLESSQVKTGSNLSGPNQGFKVISREELPTVQEGYLLCDRVSDAIQHRNNNVQHLALIAGDETEVGIKDFEEYDDLFYP